MNPIFARAEKARRKIANGEPLDKTEAEIISLAVRKLIRVGRVPFERFRSKYLIGTELRKATPALDYFRTILLHRKSDVWYPESTIGQISIFSVYCSSQVEPVDPNVLDENRGKPDEYADDLLDDTDRYNKYVNKTYIGPSIGGSYQKELVEAPHDWRKEHITTVIQQMRRYAKELSKSDTQHALEKRDELEEWLRNAAKATTKSIPKGNVYAVLDAYISAQFWRREHKKINGPKNKVYDSVRQACKYEIKMMLKSDDPNTRDIAKHLQEYVKIRMTCEYTGDWRWHF